MKTRLYRVKKVPLWYYSWLNKQYLNDDKNKYTFKDFYWYWHGDQKVYGCFVMNNNNLWSNPQVSINDL
jgi:hypothetical protein